MDIEFAKILSFFTSIFLPLSVVCLLLAIILDIWKRKFYWSKYALIFVIITVVLLFFQIKLTYQITGDILNK